MSIEAYNVSNTMNVVGSMECRSGHECACLHVM